MRITGVLSVVGSSDQSTGAAGGDREFERFVVADSPGLLRSAYLLCGDRGHAEDLLQTALLRTLRRWSEIDSSPRAYALEVLVNLARDRRRTLRRRPREAPEDQLPGGIELGHESHVIEHGAITAAAQQLPRAQREVLACRYLLDLSVSETAVALDLPEGTVKSHTARALQRLRELLVDDQTAARSDGARGANA
jgi:RNA polymerase sigma-70 factor (sigma-E family)